MRVLLILAFIANVALALVGLAILPDRVATHFGAGGAANGWGSRTFSALLFVGIDALLFFPLFFAPRLVLIFPPRWMNLPNKEYWLREENRPRLRAMVASFAHEFGVVIFAFLFFAQMLTIQANRSQPVKLNEKALVAALIVFIGYTVVWCVRYFRAFRIPKA